MENSCVKQVPRNKFVMIYSWQLDFCDANRCAAMLMNFFECWHNSKLKNYEQRKIRQEPVTQNDLLQYHTIKELMSGILYFFKRDKVIEAKKLLVQKGIITIHTNPGIKRKDKSDQTDFFLFHPGVVNKWNDENFNNEGELNLNTVSTEEIPKTHSRFIDSGIKTGVHKDLCPETVDSTHSRFIDGAESINRPCINVTENTTENTINNSSNTGLNSDRIFPDKEKTPPKKFSKNYAPIFLAEWQEYFSASTHGLSFSDNSVTSKNCGHMFREWIDRRLTIGFIRKIVDERMSSTTKINSPSYFSSAVMQRHEEKLKARANEQAAIQAREQAQRQHQKTQAFSREKSQYVKPNPEKMANNLEALKSALQPADNKPDGVSV